MSAGADTSCVRTVGSGRLVEQRAGRAESPFHEGHGHSTSCKGPEITGVSHMEAGLADLRSNGGRSPPDYSMLLGKLPGPTPMSTMPCRTGTPKGPRCVVGKKSTMRCRSAPRNNQVCRFAEGHFQKLDSYDLARSQPPTFGDPDGGMVNRNCLLHR